MDLTDGKRNIETLHQNLAKVIRGKDEVIRLSIVALLSKGHLLIEDVPGVGKTTLAHGIARSIHCSFQRIQFTSDLLPSDIVGVTVYNQSKGSFEFRRGPIFANIVLADEINRTTPKTQSALLEAMNDRQVSVENETYSLPDPFLVLATQNPLEYEGTFPLPESQLDRFLMCLRIGYPDRKDEKAILTSSDEDLLPDNLKPVIEAADILSLQALVDEIKIEESLIDYILDIVKATRELPEAIELGVSPRGTMAFQRATKAMALVEGRDFCIPDDIKALAPHILAHRIIPNPERDVEDVESREELVREILTGIEAPL